VAYSWQYAFFLTGGAGVLYALLWFTRYRKPSEYPSLSIEERTYILAGSAGEPAERVSLRHSLPFLVGDRHFWAIIVGRMIGDTPWIFYVMWIPKFLSDTRGLDLKTIGHVAWLPFLLADLGSLGGGSLSGWFLRRNRTSALASRLKVMSFSAILSTFTFTIYFLSSTTAIVVVMGLMMLSTMAWMVNLSTLPVDVFPKRLVATSVGLTTVGAILGQLVFTYFIGIIVQRYSYGPLFFIMSILPALAYGVIRLILPSAANGLGHESAVQSIEITEGA
jgi:ACS family hexuronate transporter-like MFS transporter